MTIAQALSLYEKANPFDSPSALRDSNYSAYIQNRLTRLLDWREPLPRARLADRALRAFLTGGRFPCVAGRAAVASGGYRFGYYGDFADLSSTHGIARDLAAFVAERPSMTGPYATFIAVFDGPRSCDERWFEQSLWCRLQSLADLDRRYFRWDPAVSGDPASPQFAFSFAEEAFFVVGMHPNSSRLGRRFFLPALAFNSHRQFAEARRTGRFERLQRMIRKNEIALQGSINPELCEFGERSEARQYSGRPTETGWRCPFRPHS
ncbi:MAG: YqcI/YcgG family protein [Candidatus Eremiobacteraeota bacterium]|nr:YqcI/YcgG family protein [Candidatus Eremiobacteraeota bacterium]